MNIQEAIKSIRFSASPYLEQQFRAIVDKELSQKKIDSIVSKVKTEENKRFDPESLTEFDEREAIEYSERIQSKTSKQINDVISFIGSQVHNRLIDNHPQHCVSFYCQVLRQDYVSHVISTICSMLPSNALSNPVVQPMIDKLFERLNESFLEKILMLDDESDLPIKDTTLVQAIYLSESDVLRVKYSNQTKIYQNILKECIRTDKDIIALVCKILSASGLIKLQSMGEGQEQKVKADVISHVVSLMITNPTRYSETKMDQFLYKLSVDKTQSLSWNPNISDKVHISALQIALMTHALSFEVYKQDIMRKIMSLK